MKLIHKRAELVELAKQLGTRPDWHEPDEQDLTAEVHGASFDNAGFWPAGQRIAYTAPEITEQHVILFQDDVPVAAVNLATLFAWATGYDAPPPLVDVSPKELESLKVAQLRGQVQALQNLLRALRPTIEAGTKTQWGAALRDLNKLVPND